MRQYVAWARERRGQGGSGCDGASADAFYEDADAQDMYRAFVRGVVLRTNTLTGTLYR